MKSLIGLSTAPGIECILNTTSGPGKYIFEIGCEQHGEYVPVEMTAGDGEDDEAASVTIPKWKASKWAPITCDQ